MFQNIWDSLNLALGLNRVIPRDHVKRDAQAIANEVSVSYSEERASALRQSVDRPLDRDKANRQPQVIEINVEAGVQTVRLKLE